MYNSIPIPLIRDVANEKPPAVRLQLPPPNAAWIEGLDHGHGAITGVNVNPGKRELSEAKEQDS